MVCPASVRFEPGHTIKLFPLNNYNFRSVTAEYGVGWHWVLHFHFKFRLAAARLRDGLELF